VKIENMRIEITGDARGHKARMTIGDNLVVDLENTRIEINLDSQGKICGVCVLAWEDGLPMPSRWSQN
jgi:uncharacterized protein YuzE